MGRWRPGIFISRQISWVSTTGNGWLIIWYYVVIQKGPVGDDSQQPVADLFFV